MQHRIRLVTVGCGVGDGRHVAKIMYDLKKNLLPGTLLMSIDFGAWHDHSGGGACICICICVRVCGVCVCVCVSR